MLLTLTSTTPPATDLGHLLRKHPGRVHSFDLSFGKAQVFYPEATEERCTAALLLDVDPIGLVRSRRGPAGEGRSLEQYVNDRPYVASSFLSVAISDVFGSAMAGKSKERQELVDTPLPLKTSISVLPCRGGEAFLRRLFEPLGYAVSATRHSLDDKFADWGDSPYLTVTLEGRVPLRRLLTHLYVLIPVWRWVWLRLGSYQKSGDSSGYRPWISLKRHSWSREQHHKLSSPGCRGITLYNQAG